MIANLKKGDRIVTSGGLHGRVTGLDETVLTVEIADKVRVKISRGNVAGIVQSAPPAAAETKES
jgi:preprotein translocase subunit YajC